MKSLINVTTALQVEIWSVYSYGYTFIFSAKYYPLHRHVDISKVDTQSSQNAAAANLALNAAWSFELSMSCTHARSVRLQQSSRTGLGCEILISLRYKYGACDNL